MLLDNLEYDGIFFRKMILFPLFTFPDQRLQLFNVPTGKLEDEPELQINVAQE